MAIAFYRMLRFDAATPGRRGAIILFLVQLVFNAGWSFRFFDALLLATIHAFWRIDRTAAYLLIPYATWLAFATYLNVGVWWLN